MNRYILRPYLQPEPDLVALAQTMKMPASDGTGNQKDETKKNTGTPPLILPQPDFEPGKPESYILLPAGQYGGEEYPDLYIGMKRVSLDARLEKALQTKGIQLSNKGNEVPRNNSQGFLGYINHQEALLINNALGGFTPSLLLSKEFLSLLEEGIFQGKVVHNGAGSKIQIPTLEVIYKDITEVRSPWRAEWYGTRFHGSNISYCTVTPKGVLQDVTRQMVLNVHLTQQKTPGIDFRYWLKNATSQGLPPSHCPDGALYYWPPKNDTVARFGAGSDRAYLVRRGSDVLGFVARGTRSARENLGESYNESTITKPEKN